MRNIGVLRQQGNPRLKTSSLAVLNVLSIVLA